MLIKIIHCRKNNENNSWYKIMKIMYNNEINSNKLSK